MLDNIPCLLIGDELKDSLQVLPEYDSSIMTAPVSDRLISLSNIYDIFYPSPMACEVYYKLYFAFANSIKRKTTSKTAYGISGGTDSFTIIGASGVGKSTAIGRAIKIISNDDILLINNSKVIPFIVVQTPSDASIKGVLIFIKEPHISTTTYRSAISNSISLTGTTADFIIEGINKYLMALAKEQIRLAFEKAEQEVTFIRERTKEGLRQAKANGVVLGRAVGTTVESKKGKKSKTIIAKHSKTFGGSLSDSEVMQLCGCSRKSYYKYKKQVAESLEKVS